MKTFVIDTNVILYDPRAIFKFEENDVYIPLVVIEEIDRFKKDLNDNGRNARYFSRIVDELRSKGKLNEGIELSGGGKLFVSIDLKASKKYTDIIDLHNVDNKILATALALSEKENEKVVLITKDINLRLKADLVGLLSEDYGKKDRSFDELYAGTKTLEVAVKDLETFKKEKFLLIENAETHNLFPNQYIILCEENNESHRLLGRYSKNRNGIVPLIPLRDGVWGIYPRNIEQQFAIDALLNEEVKLVSLVGKAGTGKTLMALAAGLEMTISQEKYSRLLVSRPIQPMGKDLGFLPGDVDEKLAPWMQPIFDNMDFLFGQQKNSSNSSYEDLINHGLLHVEPLTYIRGRSIPGQYLIVDESQNLTPHEVKTILTRAGDGTKIILTGDCHQIDSPYLDEINNGLTYCAERLKEEDIVAHVTLKAGERSELSEIASKRL